MDQMAIQKIISFLTQRVSRMKRLLVKLVR